MADFSGRIPNKPVEAPPSAFGEFMHKIIGGAESAVTNIAHDIEGGARFGVAIGKEGFKEDSKLISDSVSGALGKPAGDVIGAVVGAVNGTVAGTVVGLAGASLGLVCGVIDEGAKAIGALPAHPDTHNVDQPAAPQQKAPTHFRKPGSLAP